MKRDDRLESQPPTGFIDGSAPSGSIGIGATGADPKLLFVSSVIADVWRIT
jgi:hypothetical protein